MKPEEQKVLGILATIFGAIALLGSWIPFINYLSFFIAIVALILGIIGLIANLKKRKTMAIIGTSLAIASVVLFFTTQILYANVYKEFNRSYREASSSMERDLTDDTIDSLPEDEEEDDTFTWTQEQFDALIEGDLDNKGKGGINYKDIIKKHGLPDSEFDFTLGGLRYEKNHLYLYWRQDQDCYLNFCKTGQWTALARPKTCSRSRSRKKPATKRFWNQNLSSNIKKTNS